MAIVTGLYSSLEGQSERDRVTERDRRPVRREEIVLVAMRTQSYVSQQKQSN